MISKISELLEAHDIKPTPNRLLVLEALFESESPVSLIELEDRIDTMGRPSISRVLSLFSTSGIIHSMEDGKGITKYEICKTPHSNHENDMHVHFYCEKCERVYCLEDTKLPQINVPEGFKVKGLNYMLKGICPECSRKN